MDMMWYRRRGLMVTPHIERVTGAIASFNSDYNKIPVKSLICNIDPIQEGEGDPSPENVRPISGRTGLSVTRTGKNLLPMPIASGSYDYTTTVTVNDDKSFVISKTSASGWTTFILGQFTLKPGTYTIIESADNTSNAQLVLDKVIGDTTEVLVTTRYTKRQTFTIESDTLVQARYLRSAMADNVLTKLMLFIGNTATATDYKPYKGNTYSVDWETEAGTVYGGTIDVVSGKLTVLGVKDTVTVVDGRLQSQFFSAAGTGQTVTVLGNNVRISLNRVSQISNMDTVSSRYSVKMANLCPHYFAYNVDTTHWYINNQLHLYLPKVDVGETIESYRTFLQDNPFEVYIQFATPTEIQLTPQEIRTLLGENNIWCDTGYVSVGYWKWGK